MWTRRTMHVGGGDNPLTSIRIYQYKFSENYRCMFRRKKHVFRLPFETIERVTRGDELGHRLVLQDAPFFARGQSILDWAKDCISTGKASFRFEVDGSLEYVMENKVDLRLIAKFSDPNHAVMFKLAFMGN